MSQPLIELTDAGLYCRLGGFHIDPWRGVDRAVITHAHSDHARWGSRNYLAAEPGRKLMALRLGAINLDTLAYGQTTILNGVSVSLHPAGHVLGSSQVRVEHDGEIWVVSGDYKVQPDSTAAAIEPLRCHTFITESTFAMPVYRWQLSSEVFASINEWWSANRDAGKASILFAYSLGKAQRILAGIDAGIGPIYTHGAVENVTQAYRESGVVLPATTPVGEEVRGGRKAWSGALIVAPPSADGSPWMRKFQPASTAVASGWMQIRGARRRRSVDRGFVLSDHADWPGLLQVIEQTSATRVLATHGFTAVLARWLRDRGIDGGVIATRFGDDEEPPQDTAA